MRHPRHVLAAALALALASCLALAQAPGPQPLASGHPLIGTWRIDLPQASCHELYYFRADGTTLVTSGQQASESQLQLSARPSENGFYQWIDTIVKDNGKPDCMGSVMEVGHTATNYILLDPTGKKFLLCQAEDLRTCIGPFVRQEGI